MGATINNIDDLRLEIERLRSKKQAQESELKQHFSSPANIFNTLRHLFPKTGGDQSGNGSSWLARIGLPFALNKTLFRKSGFLVKSLVGLVSQKLVPQIGQKPVSNLWNKLKKAVPGVINKWRPKNKPVSQKKLN